MRMQAMAGRHLQFAHIYPAQYGQYAARYKVRLQNRKNQEKTEAAHIPSL